MSEIKQMTVDDVISFNTETGETYVEPVNIPICALVPDTSPILREVMPVYDFENQVIGDFQTSEQLASSLVESCKQYKGYGLSANQCGIKARVFVMGNNDEYVAFFNPEIVLKTHEEVHMQEGCLSFPLLSLGITRPKEICVRYQDFTGEWKQAQFAGISARCFQHELDHLNGIVYTDICKPLSLQQGKKKRDKLQKMMKKIDNGNKRRFG